MNYGKITFFVLLLSNGVFCAIVQAKTVKLMDQGMISSYWQVPDDFNCKINIADDPTAFCQGADGIIYHKAFLGTVPGSANPNQLVNTLLQQLLGQSELKVLKQHTVPQITQYHLQKDLPLLFKQGQQVFSYVFDMQDTAEDKIGTAIFVVYVLPNRGAPVTLVEYYGVSAPSATSNGLNAIRAQFLETLLSGQYDRNYVQSINAQHLQFQNNLGTRERAFYAQQSQIHRNNMNALDNLYDGYRAQSASSDKIQAQTIDSIHESQRMIDPQTGQQYQVQGNFDFNYVNPNDTDMSFQTDDGLINPNINNEQGADYNLLEVYRD